MGVFDNIQPGDIKYRDLNNDGVIDEFDRAVIGNDKPLQKILGRTPARKLRQKVCGSV